MTTYREQGAVDLITATAAKIEPQVRQVIEREHGKRAMERGFQKGLASWDQSTVEITVALPAPAQPPNHRWTIRRIFGRSPE
jgi:hypothetical protein